MVEENKKNKTNNENKIIVEYDIYGNLIQSVKYYDNAILNISLKDIKHSISKNKPINNKFYRIYEKQDFVLNKIKTPVICKINNQYFYSYAEVGRYLGVSRQAVHQSKKRKSTHINGLKIE